jgi:hypothetical protein
LVEIPLIGVLKMKKLLARFPLRRLKQLDAVLGAMNSVARLTLTVLIFCGWIGREL